MQFILVHILTSIPPTPADTEIERTGVAYESRSVLNSRAGWRVSTESTAASRPRRKQRGSDFISLYLFTV